MTNIEPNRTAFRALQQPQSPAELARAKIKF